MSVAIKIKNLSKKYGESYALSPMDLDVAKGEVLGYLGPNGAGKTTTIRMLLGLIKPTSGRATIFGHDAQTHKMQAHAKLAYVPGETNLWPNLTGAETLYLLGSVHGSVDEDYKKLLVKRFDLDVNKKVRSYSKGNRQKLSLISGLMTRASLLLLDEPTSGLDPIMEQAFRESIDEAKRNGQTVFLSSHILSEVEALCDRVAILRAGKLIEVGTLESMRHLSAVTVLATFAGKPPEVSHLPNVSEVRAVGHQLTCQVQGSINDLLKIVTNANPISFISREPTLEELFLSLYGSDGDKG